METLHLPLRAPHFYPNQRYLWTYAVGLEEALQVCLCRGIPDDELSLGSPHETDYKAREAGRCRNGM
jgi:hypothetical protein